MSALVAPAYRAHLVHGVVHLGVGGFHRSHQAVYLHELFERGVAHDWGVVGVGTTEHDARLHAALHAQDHLWTVETRTPTGAEHVVVGSHLEHLLLTDPAGAAAVLDRLVRPTTRWVTLTVTEGGYPVDGPPSPTLAVLVAALRHRRAAGTAPFAVVSCDNLQHNGQVARAAVVAAAEAADPADPADPDVARWIADEVAFPSSMVDRITPATTPDDVARIRRATGRDDACPVVAEPFRQWVLEHVPGVPRPPLEEVGVQVVADVAPYELLKLRVLNGGHQALAWAGLLLGHRAVHEAATDPDVVAFLRRFLHAEVLPTLDPVPGTDPAAYAETVLARFAQAELPDTLERLAAHSADRVPGFVLAAAAGSVVAGRPVPVTAAVVALWWTTLRRAHASGTPTLVAAPDLAAAGGDGEALDAFLADPGVLGGLAGDPRFGDEVRAAEALLRSGGPRGLLRSLTADDRWRTSP
ncbi:mannitol dehydrogenase family protein [Nocardioides sp. CPCC 205120]|uniref:mannitol dehydrogenase family protein n=1 Tax=Nocardioides sp. CPCC 205120 TaxID=3406462 RepID=UPI003B502F10